MSSDIKKFNLFRNCCKKQEKQYEQKNESEECQELINCMIENKRIEKITQQQKETGDNTKILINNNKKIDNILHVVCMISNPCSFKKRIKLAKEFIERMLEEKNIILYIIEIVYNNNDFEITSPFNKNHLQLRKSTPLWHKENALNIGINKLLPYNWKAVAWIDMDIYFENPHWVSDTLRILNTKEPKIIQLFSHAVDMDKDEDPLNIFQGFAYQYMLGKEHGHQGLKYWHPGYAWACNRQAYDKVKLYDLSIIGSGDYIIAMSLINKESSSLDKRSNINFKKSVEEYANKIRGIKLGYTPGTIRHYFHGSKINRKYVSRNEIIIKHNYDPYKHVKYDEDGFLIPTDECPPGLIIDIYNYFLERNEDE